MKGLLPKAHRLSWLMLFITTISILMNSIDRFLLPTLMPAIIEEFQLTDVQAGWLNSLSFIGILVGAITLGFFSDYIGGGYKRAYSWLVAVLISVVASIATAFSYTYNAFIALRVIMGIGTGGAEPINVSLISEWWQKQNHGFAIGVHHTGFPIGQFVGPALIGLIIAATNSWRDVFLIIPLLGIPIIVATIALSTKKNYGKVVTWIKENEMTPPSIETGSNKSFVETVKEGLLVLKNKNCLMAILLFFAFIWAEIGISTFLTLHLTREVGLTLADAAIISGASGITGWMGQIFWGAYSDHKGRKLTLIIIMAGWLIATVLCGFIASATMGWIILIFWGLFRNSPFPVLYAVLIDNSPKNSGAGMGLMIGFALGMAGFLVSPFAGYIIANHGFSMHYNLITVALLIACIPLFMLKDIAVEK